MSDTVKCGDCQAPMVLRDSKFGKFWGCTRFPECRGTHGAHPDGRPLGTPASKAVKLLRIEAHDLFDLSWKSGRMSRNKAYKWLRKAMGMTEAEAHIGLFGEAECRKLIGLLKEMEGKS